MGDVAHKIMLVIARTRFSTPEYKLQNLNVRFLRNSKIKHKIKINFIQAILRHRPRTKLDNL